MTKGERSGQRIRHASRHSALCLLCGVLLLSLAGCGAGWQSAIAAPDGTHLLVNRARIRDLDQWRDALGSSGVPVEALLWQAGYPLVDRVVAVEEGGARTEYLWSQVADTAEWSPNGQVSIAGVKVRLSSLEVIAPSVLEQVEASITDLAPTASAALGLPAPAEASGWALAVGPARHVLLILLDGLGFTRFLQARDDGFVPVLSALGEPLLGITTFPPITSVSMASLLTGAPPQVHGADVRGVRETESELLFHVVKAAGKDAVAVEGESLPFNLSGVTVRLSEDRDGDGSTDDNVLANALAVLQAGMPGLLFVHFHGVDDEGHEHGPGSAEQLARIEQVDAAVGELIRAVPGDTLILIAADHGQHAVDEDGRLGSHGHLTEEDMLIPIWLMEK